MSQSDEEGIREDPKECDERRKGIDACDALGTFSNVGNIGLHDH